jgi:hypothetical protein
MTTSLSLKWLRKKLDELGGSRQPYHLDAILHIYLGTISLLEIAARSGSGIDALIFLRSNAAFMQLADTYKQECAQWIREDLALNDRMIEEYDSIAADYAMLEEVLRMQIRVPLFSQLREVSLGIKTKSTCALPIEPYDLGLFRKLYLFFLFTEKYLPTLTSRSLPDLRQIAEETVWPAVSLDEEKLNEVLKCPASFDVIAGGLKSELDRLIVVQPE